MDTAARPRRLPAAFVVVLVALLLLGAWPAAGATARLDLAETVFSWRSDRCDDADTPDAPARAFRDAGGTVHLFATHFANRASLGPGLDHVSRDCRIVFEGGRNDDPSAFDDRLWLTAFHTGDGTTVHGLVHAEYHGHLRPAGCPSRRYMDCWWNAIVQVVSTDGGRTFRRAAAGNGLVAAPSLPYAGPQGHPLGYFNPSDIIAYDGYLYVFVFAAASGAQQRGACLLRTDDIADPARWRAWDGAAFAVRFTNPYARPPAPAAAVACTPVAGLAAPVTGLVQEADGTFLAVFSATGPDGGGGTVTGVRISRSRDLLHWSASELLVAAPMMYDFPCSSRVAYAYPSIIDPQSPSPTFASIGGRPFLYLTRFNLRDCRLTMDRDLIRIPLTAP
ncbi:MAG: hypothetical protein JNM48_02895 [Rhodospirillales bacterium]|nr:hypothetical protein [Rhodospirillales bacterium]